MVVVEKTGRSRGVDIVHVFMVNTVLIRRDYEIFIHGWNIPLAKLNEIRYGNFGSNL